MRIGDIFVTFTQQIKPSLNNRFSPSSRIETDGVIIMDCNIKVHLEDIEMYYQVWSRNRDNIVGAFPRWFIDHKKVVESEDEKRTHTNYDSHRSENERYTYLSDTMPPTDGKENEGYALLLTKFVVLHSRYLELYTCEERMLEVHDLVDEFNDCEDIAMSLLVSNIIERPASLFLRPLHPIGEFRDTFYSGSNGNDKGGEVGDDNGNNNENGGGNLGILPKRLRTSSSYDYDPAKRSTCLSKLSSVFLSRSIKDSKNYLRSSKKSKVYNIPLQKVYVKGNAVNIGVDGEEEDSKSESFETEPTADLSNLSVNQLPISLEVKLYDKNMRHEFISSSNCIQDVKDNNMYHEEYDKAFPFSLESNVYLKGVVPPVALIGSKRVE